MKKSIYYFSGTGNSFFLAKSLAEKMNAALKPIATYESLDKIDLESEVIGLIFPVYHQGLPLIVKRFVKKIQNLEGHYIFAVCTCGNSPCLSLEYLDTLLKKRHAYLSGGFSVQMPYNYLTPTFAVKDFFKSFKLRKISKNQKDKLYSASKNKIEEIYVYVTEGKKGIIEKDAVVIEKIIDVLNLRNTLQKKVWLKVAGYAGDLSPQFDICLSLMDYGFNVNNNCNTCGTCAKVCPVQNILIEKNQPQWYHKCEQCFACLQWCPQKAINFREGTNSCERYTHPEVKVSDLIFKTRGVNKNARRSSDQ